MRKFTLPKSTRFNIKEWQDKNLAEAKYDYKTDPELDEDDIKRIDAAPDIHPKDFKKFRGEWDSGEDHAVLTKQGYWWMNVDKKIGKYFEANGVGELDDSGYGFTGYHHIWEDDFRFIVHQVGEKNTGKNPYLFVVDSASGNVLLSVKVGQYKKAAEFIKKHYKL